MYVCIKQLHSNKYHQGYKILRIAKMCFKQKNFVDKFLEDKLVKPPKFC